MADRKKLEEKIRKKEQEIQLLEHQVKEAKVYIQALQDVLKMFPREVSADVSIESTLRPGSFVAQAREAIIKSGRPMHVSEILKEIGKEETRNNKTGLSGSISAYVRKGEIFTRAGPNTFGLLELAQKEPVAMQPPPDFGLEPE